MIWCGSDLGSTDRGGESSLVLKSGPRRSEAVNVSDLPAIGRCGVSEEPANGGAGGKGGKKSRPWKGGLVLGAGDTQ